MNSYRTEIVLVLLIVVAAAAAGGIYAYRRAAQPEEPLNRAENPEYYDFHEVIMSAYDLPAGRQIQNLDVGAVRMSAQEITERGYPVIDNSFVVGRTLRRKVTLGTMLLEEDFYPEDEVPPDVAQQNQEVTERLAQWKPLIETLAERPLAGEGALIVTTRELGRGDVILPSDLKRLPLPADPTEHFSAMAEPSQIIGRTVGWRGISEGDSINHSRLELPGDEFEPGKTLRLLQQAVDGGSEAEQEQVQLPSSN